MNNDTLAASVTKATSPARRTQKATAPRSSQRHRTGSEETSATTEVEIKDEEDLEDEVVKTKVGRRTGSKTPTPSKRRPPQEKTPRRSSRRAMNSSTVESTPLEMVKEEEASAVHSVKRNSRKAKMEQWETLPALLDEEDDRKQPLSSPGRTTRQSSRITLNVYPQVRI